MAYPTTSTPRSTSTPSLTAIRLFNTTVTTYVTESDVTLTVYRGTTGSFVNTTFVTENTDTRFVFRGTLAADPIIVRFKENQISTSALGASTTSANPALPTPTLPTSTTTVVSSAGSENERLPTGAKAGIGAGVGIGVIALLALGSLFYYWRKRKANRDEKYPAIEQTGIEQQDSEGQRNPR